MSRTETSHATSTRRGAMRPPVAASARPTFARDGLRTWLAIATLVATQTGCDAPRAPPAKPAPPAEQTAEANRIDLAGPTIVAVLPQEAKDSGVEGAAEAVAHVRFAMSDTAKCIGYAKNVEMTTVFADRLTIRDGSSRHAIDLGSTGQGIGAILVEPGRPPKIVQPEVGASSLQHLLPQAVHDYWQVAECKRD